MTTKQPYDVYEDRRRYPRVVVNCPVDMRFRDKRLTATIYDLSPDGLQVRCDRKTLKEIHPSGRAIRKDNAPVLDVAFNVAVGDEELPVAARAVMYYFVLLPDEKDLDVALGVKFSQFQDRSDENLDAFILDAITPLEEKVLDFLDEPRTENEITAHMGAGAGQLGSILAVLVENGDIVAMESGGQRRHLRPAAAIKVLLEKTAELEKRVARLERDTKSRR